MSTANNETLAHSADVQMHLSVNGHLLRIGHLGPDYVILDNPIDHSPADAEISMFVDGRQQRWRVRVVEGLSASQHRARIGKCG